MVSVHAADTVPTDIQMPGTQPTEAPNFEAPDDCAACHAGYNDGEPQHEPATGWRGGAMGNAGRDAIFWASVAVSEQDFDGSGDLCIRCHSTGGWYAGRSTPTDGSGLAATDDDGVDCDACHLMTNPDNTEHPGVMNSPFTANCSDDPIVPSGTCESETEGYYGGGMLSISDGNGDEKLGPYDETVAKTHGFAQSKFHRDVDFCGSCHDESNPAVGDLAPNHGAQPTAPAVVSSGIQDGPVADKAAFNNPPYAYGVVQRTFSEYKASAFPTTRVGDFNNLPTDLKVAGGAPYATYQAAQEAASQAQANGGIAGDYADGTPRFFSCQSCHMHPVESAGASNNQAEVRKDLPSHDHTGGNYWFADITKYQDSQGTLRLGGGLTADQIEALDLGQQRAIEHLQQAASLQVSGNTLKVINLTGHKLISGYPEGRRMWVNIKWYDTDDTLLREDGAYGTIGASVSNPSGGPEIDVESILDLDGTNTRIYEAHYAITKVWAETIQALHGSDFELNYDRITGAVICTVGDFLLDDNDPDKKDACKGEHIDTFHFVLNNTISMDNRIPPYGMSYDIAEKRNALPTPTDQYGGGTSGSIYNYWDEISLNPPSSADHAHIELLYQGTSWEYIQFLNLANKGENAFLGQEGINMLEAWLNAPTSMDPSNRKMVAPIVMASADWIGEPETFTVGGNVSGLAGSGLVLQNKSSDDLTVSTNGAFTFATLLNDGSAYAVTVQTQPTSPDQTCTVTNDSGTIDGTDVTDVSVTCVTNTFTIGGDVSGLAGSGLVLQNNVADDLAVSTNGAFTFATPLNDDSAYTVTVQTQPTLPDQTCIVANGSGTIDGTDVTDISVTCVTNTFTISGNVSGLAGSGLVLQNKSTDDLTISTNGAFTFTNPLNDGSAYAVTVQTQPTSPDQTCGVANGSGTIDGTNVTDVIVTCISAYRLSVNVSGLGTVTSDPAGIDCGNNCWADFVAGSEIKLIAEHDPSWTHGSWVWTGACESNDACSFTLDANKEADVAFHCELITIPQTPQPIDTAATWECYDLEAVNGFEVEGPNADVSFIAEHSIELGAEFRIGAGSTFHAVIVP